MPSRISLSDQIRELVNGQGANEVTLTLSDDAALKLARCVDIGEELTRLRVVARGVAGTVISASGTKASVSNGSGGR